MEGKSKVWVLRLIAAAQTSSAQVPASNPATAGYFLIVLVAAVLALVVVIFIQTSSGRSSKGRAHPTTGRKEL